MLRVVNVEQKTEAGAGAAREADLRVDRDVVTLIRTRRWTLIAAPLSAGRARGAASPALSARRRGSRSGLPIALILRGTLGVGRRHRQTLEDARRAHDRRVIRRAQRDLDHFQPETRGIRIVDAAVRASRHFLGRPHRRRARHVDEHVGIVALLGDDGVRVRSAAGLHRRYELRTLDVRDVEYADAAHPQLADRLGHALEAAVGAAVDRLRRHEEQVAVDRHVVLRCRTQVRLHEHRLGRIGDVVDVEAVVVPLNHEVAREREIRMRRPERPPLRRRRREHAHVPRGLPGIPAPGLQPDTRIGCRRSRRHDGRNRRWHHRGRRRWRRRRRASSAASAGGVACGRHGRRLARRRWRSRWRFA